MATANPRWQNRIVGYGEESPEQLLANPRNFRIHPKPQQDALLAALREVGVVQDVIVNRASGFVVDGHLRVSLAISEQQPAIPVKYVDLEPHEEALILATFDPISALAGADREQYAALLEDVHTGEAALQGLLSEMAANAGLVPPVDPMAEWEGMPAFEHEDKTAFQSIVVHLKDQDTVDGFAALVGQKITPHTRFIWYPEIEIERYADKRYAPKS